MVISLPVSLTVKKQQTERIIEVNVPNVSERVKKNKLIAAFYTVLSAPVK